MPNSDHLRDADPKHLLRDVEQLRTIAAQVGFGTLGYVLTVAVEECHHLVEIIEDEGSERAAHRQLGR